MADDVDVNLTGVWQTAKAVSPAMIAQRSGAMVFVGSVLSHRANKEFAHYTAAKHGVLGLMRAFGRGTRRPMASGSTRSTRPSSTPTWS